MALGIDAGRAVPEAGLNPPGLDLLLFSTCTDTIRRAVDGGVAGVIIDWEHHGKWQRQRGADTQINTDTPEDLRRVRACTESRLLCRINGYSDGTPLEVAEAIAGGADEILLPMVRRIEEVEGVLRLAGGRCRVGILLETVAAVGIACQLSQLPLSRIYVGLNDLAIERGTPCIFEAVLDGTVERMREAITRVPFGFGGLTLPERGYPIPCRLLLAEMVRLDCSFTFLRRSFMRDTLGQDLVEAVRRIREAIAMARSRPLSTLAEDHGQLMEHVRQNLRWTRAHATCATT